MKIKGKPRDRSRFLMLFMRWTAALWVIYFHFFRKCLPFTHISVEFKEVIRPVLSFTCLYISSAIFQVFESTNCNKRCYIQKVVTLCHSSQITSRNSYAPTKRAEVTILWPMGFFLPFWKKSMMQAYFNVHQANLPRQSTPTMKTKP